ncbi:MAG TPA: hypothetical protein VGE01_03580 [Fimbriimonas sp.]
MFRNNVRERYLDLLDWVDIRPDLNLTWCLVMAGIIGLMNYILPFSLMFMATFMAVFAAVGLLVGGVCCALFLVAYRAARDAYRAWRNERETLRVPTWSATHQPLGLR